MKTFILTLRVHIDCEASEEEAKDIIISGLNFKSEKIDTVEVCNFEEDENN